MARKRPDKHPHNLYADEAHIVPLRDLVAHTVAPDNFDHPDLPDNTCVCIPQTEYSPHGVWIHTHHSLDNRERHEHPLKITTRLWRILTRRGMWGKVLIVWENENPDLDD